jgi:hypothetical protein
VDWIGCLCYKFISQPFFIRLAKHTEATAVLDAIRCDVQVPTLTITDSVEGWYCSDIRPTVIYSVRTLVNGATQFVKVVPVQGARNVPGIVLSS